MNPSFRPSLETNTIAKILSKCQYGEEITYETLNKAIIGDVQKSARCALQSARRSILKDGFVFDVIHGVGLKRLSPGEISLTTPRLIRKVGRAARKHAVELGTADMSAMSADEQKRHSASMLHTALLSSTCEKTITRKIEEEATKSPSLDMEAVRRIYGA